MQTFSPSMFRLRGATALIAVLLATTATAGAGVMLATAAADAIPAAHPGSHASTAHVIGASSAADSVPTASSVFADLSVAADEAVATF